MKNMDEAKAYFTRHVDKQVDEFAARPHKAERINDSAG